MLTQSSYLILGILSKADYSGYAIKRRLAKQTAFYCSESNAQIYPVLKKLEEQGLLTSNLDAASGARNKRIYSITKVGLSVLLAWLKQDCEIELYREEFLLQLSLGQHLKPAEFTQKLQHYRQSIIDKLVDLQAIIQHIKTDHAGKADGPYLLLAYDHIQTLLEAKLHWCDKVIKKQH